MSVQFGKWNFDGKPIDPKELDEVRPVLAPYGPDGEGSICKNNFAILYRAFHTTRESRREHQPYVLPSGSILTWDGRLDNREDLLGLLDGQLTLDSTDLEIVAACYDRWNTDAFARLIGDWALSICDPCDRSVILAKDFVGTRHIYYYAERDQVTWCTILDPLVLFARRSWQLEQEYIAGWLSSFPATHLTPYVGIHAVPPSCFVRLARATERIIKYWDFDSAKRIRYRADTEYEEHFRQVFRESVRRRLRSDSPILAELSGGMDSSSIVCMADSLMAQGEVQTVRVDTISYYSSEEPSWDERPYFTEVERSRGQTGWHVHVESCDVLPPEVPEDVPAITPTSIGLRKESTKQFADCLTKQGSRVVLAGTGGDEVLGGVPTPIPELSDLLAMLGWRTLANRLKVWALHQRRPWFLLLAEVLQGFLPSASAAKDLESPAWLKPEFVTCFQSALRGYRSRLRMFGPPPSFQLNISALQMLRRQVGCSAIASAPAYELRYPYLDRDLLEFIYATPREQLVRPGERRSLMRRALVSIVPPVVLSRKRKGFVCRSLMSAISARMPTWQATSSATIGEALGIFDSRAFRATLEAVHRDREVDLVRVIRTLEVEQWLRGVMRHCPPESQRQLRKLHSANSVEDGVTGTQLPSARTG